MPDTPYRAIAESTYDWETWIDEHGVVRWMNAEVERLTGHSPEACLAMPGFPLAIVHEDDRARIAEVLSRAAKGTVGNDVELRVRHKDGTLRWVAVSWQPLRVARGETRGFRTSIRDIDERKATEERVREAERRATRLARDQAELLATLSHELRSPLHCISGFGELIERRELDDETRRYVSIVREQSDAALRMVEDLLHFVSLAESRVTLRASAFDVSALIGREVVAMQPRVHASVRVGLSITETAKGAFLGDQDRVRQVVANLLANAARFTESGTIEVSLGHTAAGLLLEVRDTGIGMSEALLARVREPFVQAAPSTSSRGGAGLGLAIVERIVLAMGGSLVLESREGEGTSVRVHLPLTRAPAIERDELAPAPLLDAARVAALRILLVDDSEPARALLSAMFRMVGAEPDTASSGREAIERARASTYDVIVLDYHMPDLDGVATARHLRALPSPAPLLVLLTANVLAEPFADPARSGLDLVLAKPLRLAQVSALTRHVLDAEPSPALGVIASTESEDGVDRDVANELITVRAADGTTLLARTLPRVDAELVRVLATVRAAVARGAGADRDVLRALHGVKGLVASIGATRTVQRIATLEAALASNAPRAEHIDAVEEVYERARNVLDALSAAHTR